MGELVLHLRDEGHVLSSMDQHLLATWWERGYPLPTVLRTVRTTGEKLKKRKRPPRGLPLKSMRKQVERAGEQAVVRGAAAVTTPQDPQDGLTELRIARDRVIAALAERGLGHHSASPLKEADASLAAELSAPDPGGAFVALLRVSRSYYDGLVASLPRARRAAIRQEMTASLTDARRMDPAAIEATIGELLRRRAMEDDPVLDPRRVTEDPA